MMNCWFNQNTGPHTPIKMKVSHGKISFKFQLELGPLALGGQGRGQGRGGKLPNQRVTSPETMKYTEEYEL